VNEVNEGTEWQSKREKSAERSKVKMKEAKLKREIVAEMLK